MNKVEVYRGSKAGERFYADRSRAIKEVLYVASELPADDRELIISNLDRAKRYALSEALREERETTQNNGNKEGRENVRKSGVETINKRNVELKSRLKKMPKLTKKAKALLMALGLMGSGCALTIAGVRGTPKDYGTDEPYKNVQADVSSDVEQPPEVKYMIDFIDYASYGTGNMINDLMRTNKVGAFMFECGASSWDYPFVIRSYSDVEVYNPNRDYPDGTFNGRMGSMVDLEFAIKCAKSCGAEVGVYQYTTANTEQEADIEADYIKAFFTKLKNDIPKLDTSSMIPIAIDIEENGEEKMGIGLSPDECNVLKENRTNAILHLVDRLIEDGVTTKEKGVTIYGDLNRMADGSYVDWEKLFNTLEEKGIRTIKWNTRALSKTYDSGIEYENVDEFAKDLMQDDNNVSWMKDEYGRAGTIDFASNAHAIQAHLDQYLYTEDGTLHGVDVSVTTDSLISDMIEPQGDKFEGKYFDILDRAVEKQESYIIPDAESISKENGEVNKNSSLEYEDMELE